MKTKQKGTVKSQTFSKNRATLGRNNRLLDTWSLVHFLTGIIFGLLLPPFVAVLLMVLWEPIEILVLSPILAGFNIDFGYETLRNSLSDIVVDILGVAVGFYVLGQIFPM